MGTRGIMGFRCGGDDKLTYNHSDSDPHWLGVYVLGDLKSFIADYKHTTQQRLREIFDNITIVGQEDKPSMEQVEELEKRFPGRLKVGCGNAAYDVLRDFQGDISAYLAGLKWMVGNNDFIKDSLSCEWGYIVNIDTMRLEVWRGFQRKPDKTNRYGHKRDRNNKKYYPCAMLISFDLFELPSEADFVGAIETTEALAS